MFAPRAFDSFQVTSDITCFPSTIPVPGFGALPVNSYLIEADQPVLVDTGMPGFAPHLIDALRKRLDPSQLAWIWLTHCDADHLGALPQLLALAPSARIVTNYLGMGKLSMRQELPPERFYLINPGQSLDVGDRKLTATTLPSYDAPETMGLFDAKSSAVFSSDCFGALLDEADAEHVQHTSAALDPVKLARGLKLWTSVDAPWLAAADAATFHEQLNHLAALRPRLVLSAHLPPAVDSLAWLAAQLDDARRAPRFVGPDQAMLEAMLHAA
ncbi:MAG: MBL fold metallo-hydrolase [Polyangiaceae bacterium]